jgi:hypothetical protein
MLRGSRTALRCIPLSGGGRYRGMRRRALTAASAFTALNRSPLENDAFPQMGSVMGAVVPFLSMGSGLSTLASGFAANTLLHAALPTTTAPTSSLHLVHSLRGTILYKGCE